jgi:hypothetical protein
MNHLVQKTIFIKREIKIQETGFLYKFSKFGSENEIFIPFENLTSQRLSVKKSEIMFLVASFVMYMVTLICAESYIEKEKDHPGLSAIIITGIISTFLLALFFYNRQNLWRVVLTNYNHAFLFKNKPNTSITDEFYKYLIEARNSYLRDNYAVLDKGINYEDQLKNLKWLKSMDVLSKSEFEAKYSELKSIINPTSSIGFN